MAWHPEGAGIRSVLVGGAVVAIYTGGLHRSGDLEPPTIFHCFGNKSRGERCHSALD